MTKTILATGLLLLLMGSGCMELPQPRSASTEFQEPIACEGMLIHPSPHAVRGGDKLVKAEVCKAHALALPKVRAYFRDSTAVFDSIFVQHIYAPDLKGGAPVDILDFHYRLRAEPVRSAGVGVDRRRWTVGDVKAYAL